MKKAHGFTFVELVIGITLTTVMMLMVGKIILLMADMRHVQEMASGLEREASEACYRFARDVRTLRSSTDLLTATTSDVRFTNVDGNEVRYWQSGTDLYRNNSVLTEGVSGLQFIYLNAAGNQVAPTVSPTATNVRSVRMHMTVQRDGQSFQERAEAYLRNLN